MGIGTSLQRDRLLAPALMMLAVGLVLAFPGRGDAYVYWSSLGGFGEGEIGRAALDGSGKNRDFIRGAIGPVAVAVGTRHALWINGDAETIGRATLNGKRVDQALIEDVGFARDLAVAGDYVYWTRGNALDTDASIGRARLDGSGVERNFIAFDDPASFSTPTEIEVQAGYIYWTNAYPEGTIARARVDGSEVEQGFITGLRNPFGLAVTDSRVLWTNRGTRSISRANLDGTGVEIEFIAGAGRIPSLAADDRFIYWPRRRKIMRTRLNGSRSRVLIKGAPADSVAVDGRGPKR